MPDQVELDCGGSWVVHDLPLSEPIQAQVDRKQIRLRSVGGDQPPKPPPPPVEPRVPKPRRKSPTSTA